MFIKGLHSAGFAFGGWSRRLAGIQAQDYQHIYRDFDLQASDQLAFLCSVSGHGPCVERQIDLGTLQGVRPRSSTKHNRTEIRAPKGDILISYFLGKLSRVAQKYTLITPRVSNNR